MDYNHKSKNELLKELNEIQQECLTLRTLNEKFLIEIKQKKDSCDTFKLLKDVQILAQIGIWEWDKSTDFVKWSDELYHIVGLDTNLPAPTFAQQFKVYTPQSWNRLQAAVENALNTGDSYQLDLEMIRCDGTLRYVKAIGGVRFDADQKTIIGLYGLVQDETDCKRAEDNRLKSNEKIAENEKRMKAILDNMMDAFFEADKDGHITFVNLAGVNLYGYNSKEELIGKNTLDLYANKNDREKLLEHLQKTGSLTDWNALNLKKDGTCFWVSMNVRQVKDCNGQITGTQGVIRDISERKQAEEVIKKAGEHFQALIEKSLDGVVLLNAEGNFKYLSPAAKKMFGYNQTDEISDNPAEYTHPDDLPMVFGELVKVVNDPNYTPMLVYRFIDKQDNWHWVETTFSNLLANQSVESIVLNFRDITQRKKSEEAFLQSEEKFKKAFITSPDSINISRLSDGKFISINKGFTQIMGYTEEEALGKTTIELNIWADPADRNTFTDQLKSKGYYENLEATFRAKDGKFIHGLGSANIIEINGEPHILSITRDISQRKKSEEALLQSEEKFRKSFLTSPDSININRLNDGIYVSINHGFTQIMGYTENDVIGKTSKDLNIWTNPEDRTRLSDELKAKGSVENLEAIFKTKSGELVFGLMSANIIEINGEPHILSITRDITQRKKSEEALRLSEEKFRKAFLSSPDSITLSRLDDGMYISVNNGFSQILGHTEAEVIGKTPLDLNIWATPSDRKNFIDSLKNNGVVENLEAKFRAKDGKLVDALVSSNILEIDGVQQILSIARDITQRKKSEEALRKSENNFRLLFENSPLGIYVASPQGEILDGNASLLKMMNSPSLEATKQINLLSFPPLIESGYSNKFLRCVSKKETIFFEQEYISKWEKKIFLSTYIVPLTDVNGNVEKVYTLMEDVSERKQVEKVLIRSEKELKRAQEITHIGSWYLDLETNDVKWTEELYKMYGFDPLLPPPPYTEHMKLFTSESWELLSASLAQTSETGIPYELELRTVRNDGTNGWMWVRGETVQDSTGKITGLWGAAQDITLRKQVEEELKIAKEIAEKNEKKFRSMFNSMQEGVYLHEVVYDENGNPINYRIIETNPIAEKFLNIKNEAAIGKLATELYGTPEAPFLQIYAQVAETGDPISFEQYFEPMDKYFFISVFSPNKGEFATVFLDITESRNYQNILLQAKERAEKSEENLSITLQSIGDGVISTDVKGLVTNMNPVAENLCGWSIAEAVGKPLIEVFNIINAETREIVVNPVKKVIECGEIVGLANHTVLISKNGIEYQIADSAAPIINNEGVISGVVLVFSDVTEKYAAQKSIQESEERYRSLINNLEAGIVVHAPDTSIVTNNQRAAILLGLSDDQMRGKAAIDPVWKFVNEENRTLAVENYPVNMIVKAKIPQKRQVMGIHHSGKKEVVWVLVNGFPVLNSAGEITEIVISFIDITEQKQVEERLRENEEKYRLLHENAGIGIGYYKTDGTIISYNKLAAKNMNGEPKDFGGKSIFDVFPKPDAEFYLERIKQSFLSDQPISYEDKVSLPIGEKFFLSTISKITDSDNQILGIQIISQDITERKQIENELISAILKSEKSEERFRNYIQSSPTAIFLSNENGKYTFVNDAACELLGYTYEEMLKFSISDILVSSPTNDEARSFRDLKEKGEIHNIEKQLIRKDGQVIDIILDGKKLSENEFIAFVKDITDRKRAEREIIIAKHKADESELKFRLMYENASMGIARISLDFEINAANKAYCDMLGYTENELIGKKLHDITHPEIIEENIELQLKLKQGLIPSFQLEKAFIHKNGHTVYGLLTSTLIKNAGNEPLYFLGNVQDITSIKHAQIKLKSSEEKFRKAFYTSPDAIVLSRMHDGVAVSINQGFVQITGYNENESTGNNSLNINIWVDRSDKEKLYHLIKTKGFAENMEAQFRKKDGCIVHGLLSATVIELDGVPHIISITRDISRIKQYENELIKAKEKAEESDRLKSAFLANMSHEIRTPMNGILGFADLLKNPSLSGDEQKEYIQIIEKSGARMLNTINDIVNISKIESGLMDIKLSQMNINHQIDLVFNTLKLDAEKKNLKLSFTNSLPDDKAIIITDSEKIYGILTNLVKNAIKYTQKGTVEFGYYLKAAITNLELVFYIKDTGIGISKDKQETIFERFIQVDIEDKMARQGAGLGLAISRAYVELLGGKIWVESELDKGSVFSFSFPFEPIVTEKAIAQAPSADLLDKNPFTINKILIVEDDSISAMLLKQLIKNYSKNVIIAKDGLEAVTICQQNPDIDLIFMDIQLPKIDGYKATKQIRQFNNNVIIIAQTAFALTGDKEKALEAGCNEYLSKPIKYNALIAVLKRYFDKIG